MSDERPYGVLVAVWRAASGEREWLLLHRRHAGGPAFEGDWAWTPPSGARLPGETVEACASRELREETGLMLDAEATDCGFEDWAVFVAEAPADAVVQLDDEHDRYRWAPLEEVVRRCLPRPVADQVRCVAARLGATRVS